MGITSLVTLKHNECGFIKNLRPNPLKYIPSIHFLRMLFNVVQVCYKDIGYVVCVKLILHFFVPNAIQRTMNLSNEII